VLTVASLLIMLFQANTMEAQVTSVHYYLKYNPTACYYEAHLVVVSGSTSASFLPLAGNLQFTIVVPHTTPVIAINKVADVNPFVQGSSTAVPWNMPSSRLNAPAVTPGVDYIAMTLNISGVTGTKVYPALSPNTDIILTTFTLSGPLVCGGGVRMWRNNADDGNPDPGGASVYDPSGAASGMLGADFNNSFTVSNPTETYSGNGTSIGPPSPNLALSGSCTPPLIVNSTASLGSVCGDSLRYSWTGPSSFSSTNHGFTIALPTTANFGYYFLTVTDTLGCSTTQSILIPSCPLLVKLSTFSGKAAKCNAILSWQSSETPGQEQYEVQYSKDGQVYMTVGRQTSLDGNGGYYSYQYTQGPGKGYYRLKVTDMGGKVNYSQTISVETNCEEHKISISPNPTSSYIKVSGVVAGNEVRVMDMLGQMVTSSIANSNVATLDLSAYPAGVYEVMVVQGQSTLVAGQVIKK